MITFELVNESDLSLVRDVAIKAFEEDLIKYGALPPGIEKIRWHKDKMNDGYYYKLLRNN